MTGEPHKVVLIEWEDAAYELDPQIIADIKPRLIRTVGWIIKEDNDALVIASEWNAVSPTGYRQALAIPNSLIRQRIQLRKK